MASSFNYHEFSGNREVFLEEEVIRLEAELHQREQDYADLMKEAKEILEVQIGFQDSTDKIIESKDQEIASLTRELGRKTKELEKATRQLNAAMTASLDWCCGGVDSGIFNAKHQGEDADLDCRGDGG